MKYIIGSIFIILLITGCDNGPEPIIVIAPKSVSVKTAPLDKKTLILIIHKDQSLSWLPGNVEDSTLATKISPATVDNLKTIITKYKKDLGAEGDKMKIVLKETNHIRQDSFKMIVQVLKEMDIYKFSIL